MTSPRFKHLSRTAVLLVAVSLAGVAHAASVFYTFDTALDGTGSFTTSVSGNDGFASVSSVSLTGSKLNQTGGAASYVDPLGNTWLGSGGSATPGHTIGWGDPSTGNSFSVTLDTTGLENLNVRLDVRAANTGSSVLTAFSSFTYSIDGGAATAISVPLTFQTGGNAFYEWTADLSSISALANQSSVTLKWGVPNLSGFGSLRIDNLEITASTAIPEPSSYAAFAGLASLGALAVRRRRYRLQ